MKRELLTVAVLLSFACLCYSAPNRKLPQFPTPPQVPNVSQVEKSEELVSSPNIVIPEHSRPEGEGWKWNPVEKNWSRVLDDFQWSRILHDSSTTSQWSHPIGNPVVEEETAWDYEYYADTNGNPVPVKKRKVRVQNKVLPGFRPLYTPPNNGSIEATPVTPLPKLQIPQPPANYLPGHISPFPAPGEPSRSSPRPSYRPTRSIST